MKALTLHQPWASLVAEGVKRIETRSWSTSYRGPLAIHAGKSTEWDGFKVGEWTVHVAFADPPEIRRLGSVRGGELVPDRYERGLAATASLGAVVAVVDLVDVAPIVDLMTGEGMPHEGASPVAYVYPDGELIISHHFEVPVRSIDVSDQRPYGDFTLGRYAWLLADVRKLPEPIPAKGKQGLWDWND